MRKSGFTLIELVMVIVIIGILAAVAIPRFMDLSTEAKRARCQADVGAIRTGISGWYAKYHASVVNGSNVCPEAGMCEDSGVGQGFPTKASMLESENAGFANFTFGDKKMPPKTDKVVNQTNEWNVYYNNTSGVMDQVGACGA